MSETDKIAGSKLRKKKEFVKEFNSKWKEYFVKFVSMSSFIMKSRDNATVFDHCFWSENTQHRVMEKTLA